MKTPKYELSYVLIPILIMFLIFSLHTVTNEQKIAEPPNDEWSNSLQMMEDINIVPSIIQDNGTNVEIFTNVDNQLNKLTLNPDNTVTKNIITVKNGSFNQETKMDKKGDLLIWLTNDQLQAAVIKGTQLEPIGFSVDKVKSYSWVRETDDNYLLASTEEGLKLYLYRNNQFELVSWLATFPSSEWITGIKSNNTLEVYSLSVPKEINLNYYKTTYSFDSKDWQASQLLSSDMRLESMFNVSYVNFVPSDDDMSVYMISKVRLRTDQYRKIEVITFNRNNGEVIQDQMKIENPVLFGGDSPNTEYLRYIKTINGMDYFIAVASAGEGREKGNYKIVKLGILNGEVQDYQFINKGSTYAKYPLYLQSNNGDYAVWSETVNDGSKLMITSQNPSFKAFANEKMKGKWLLAAGYAFQDSWIAFLTFLKGMIWLLIPLLILIFISFLTRPEWMDEKYKWIAGLSILLFIIIQMVDMDFFYKPYIVPYMPGWLTFSGSKIAIPIIFSLLLLHPTLSLMKKIQLPSPFATFFYFVIVDLILINLLYAPYMVF